MWGLTGSKKAITAEVHEALIAKVENHVPKELNWLWKTIFRLWVKFFL